MDFLKKHYEKLLLGVVLIGLLLAIGSLPILINREKQTASDLVAGVTHPKVAPLTNLDLSIADNTLKRMGTPVELNFSAPQRLFNPRTWQQTKDGKIIPKDSTGPSQATVTNITPLYTIIQLGSINVAADGTITYDISVERQAAPKSTERRPRTSRMTLHRKTDIFELMAVQGAAENPTNLVLTLNDTGETANISKDHPFKRVDGYMASITYKLENKSWKDRRIGDALNFNGEDYIIVAITQNEVVLSARSNQKKWTIKYNPSPSSPNPP
jgi:hypothetical protein